MIVTSMIKCASKPNPSHQWSRLVTRSHVQLSKDWNALYISIECHHSETDLYELKGMKALVFCLFFFSFFICFLLWDFPSIKNFMSASWSLRWNSHFLLWTLGFTLYAFFFTLLFLHIHRWYESGWRPCSRTCGKGIQLRQILCRQKINQSHYETLDDSSCTEQKPIVILQQDCNKIACPAEWKPSAWSEVSAN